MNHTPSPDSLKLKIDPLEKDLAEKAKELETVKKELNWRTILMDASLDGMAIIDQDHRVVHANQRFAQMLGYSPEEILDLHTWEYEHLMSEEGIRRKFADLTRTKTTFETLHRRKDGSLYPAEITAVGCQVDGQNLALTVTRDISERKQAEQETLAAQTLAKENEKYALVGQVAGKMAHDFNNILGIIMGNTEIALADCPKGHLQETFDLILDQTLRGRKLTRNLVAFAREREPEHYIFKISHTLDSVLDSLKKDLRAIRVTSEVHPDLPYLSGDPDMIEHCLVNLLQNAVHAVSRCDHPAITLNTWHEDGRILTTITDNGCGIPEEVIDHIFEPAFTLKGSRDVTASYPSGLKGSGYGLANVKKYVEQHTGTVKVESVFGQGTTVTLCFPVSDKIPEYSPAHQDMSIQPVCGKKLLVVEDEPDISRALVQVLQSPLCGHRVDVAETGPDALGLFARTRYDLVSLDHILSGTDTGMDVYQKIRQTDQEVPILFFSGNLGILESIKSLKAADPFIDHLSKPSSQTDYLQKINRLLSGGTLKPVNLS